VRFHAGNGVLQFVERVCPVDCGRQPAAGIQRQDPVDDALDDAPALFRPVALAGNTENHQTPGVQGGEVEPGLPHAVQGADRGQAAFEGQGTEAFAEDRSAGDVDDQVGAAAAG